MNRAGRPDSVAKGALVYSLANVHKTREKGGSIFSLAVPRFEIREGEFVAIIGESGCGKSTLLDMLGLTLSPTQADVFTIKTRKENMVSIVGLSETELAAVRMNTIGYVLQTGGLLPFLTVRENILLPCRINNRGDMHAHALALSRQLGIEDQLDKKPQYLSGGQRQRAAITRALAHQPPIVLADEPTAAVDKLTAGEILKAFKMLTATMGVTLVMVTHDVNLVADAADRLFTFEIDKKNGRNTHSICVENGRREFKQDR